MITLSRAGSEDTKYSPTLGLDFQIGKSSIFINSSFVKIPGYPGCCPTFESAEGNGEFLGLGMKYYLSDDIRLDAGINYSKGNFLFAETQSEIINVSGELYEGKFDHILDIGFNSVNLSIGSELRLFNELWFFAGFSYFVPIEMTFEQFERISQPADRGIFVDTHTRERNNYTGDISDLTQGSFNASLGISYRLPLDNRKKLYLVPKIQSQIALIPVIDMLNWKYNSLDLSIGLEYNFNDIESIETKVPVIVIPQDAILMNIVPVINSKEEIDFDLEMHRDYIHHILVQPASMTVEINIANGLESSGYRINDHNGSFLLIGTETISRSNFDALKIYFLNQHEFDYDNWNLYLKHKSEEIIIKAGTYFEMNSTFIPNEQFDGFNRYDDFGLKLEFSNNGEKVYSKYEPINLSVEKTDQELYHFDIYNIEKLKLIDASLYEDRVEVFASDKIMNQKIKNRISSIISNAGKSVFFMEDGYFEQSEGSEDSISIFIKFTLK